MKDIMNPDSANPHKNREVENLRAGCLVSGIILFFLSSILFGSWLLDVIGKATNGTWIESALNFISEAGFWLAFVVVGISIIAGMIARRRNR